MNAILDHKDLWSPWLWSWKLQAAACAFGVTVGGALLLNKYRPRPHDNIPLMAKDEFHPIFGHLQWVRRMRREKPGGFIHDYHRKMGYPSITCDSHLVKVVLVFHPIHVKHIWETNFEKAGRTEPMKYRAFELLGDGIFSSNGEQWKFHRKVASRMFSMRNLQHYMFETSLSNTRGLIEKLKQFDGKSIDINEILGRFTMDTFCEIAFGKSTESVASFPEEHAFGVAFDDLVERISMRNIDPFWKLKRQLNVGSEWYIHNDHTIIKEFVQHIVSEKNQHKSSMSDESGMKSYDLLSLYLKHDPNLKFKDLYDIALNFIIAGRDTTRMLLSWWIWEICKPQHKEIRDKLYLEVDSFIEEPTYSDIGSGFKYLEQTLCETLRLNPSVSVLPRQCWKSIDLQKIDGEERAYRINPDDLIIVPLHAMARNPKVWGDDASEFKPERWTKGLHTFDQYKFPHFNVNPRRCLGMNFAMQEAKIFALHFLRNFTFEQLKGHSVVVKPGVIRNMRNGLLVDLTCR